ncbi:beta strand repeat-containing protein [Posidoniimonas polymericola]|uniref:beta strand repeat-containing protein n=1 Tax=Posidoniimonas polymericola TaxID=2528002 RepID=UPI0011B5A1C0|nr:dockerin type I domain-containing protein [Posidoniimonas polymericola]
MIDVPPELLDGVTLLPDTQLNVLEGGTVGHELAAGTYYSNGNIEVNVLGGDIGDDFSAYTGTTVNVVDGSIGNNFTFRGEVHLLGGVIGDSMYPQGPFTWSGGVLGKFLGGPYGVNNEMTIVGDNFTLDGVLVTQLPGYQWGRPLQVPAYATLSGTLTDGTPFIFRNVSHGKLPSQGVLLQHQTTPAPIPREFIASEGEPPIGIRFGQTLIVDEGSTVPDYLRVAPGATLEVTGGMIGQDARVLDADVTMTSGTIGDFFSATGESTVTISDGIVGDYFSLYDGSELLITGGVVGSRFSADSESRVRIQGGVFGARLAVAGELALVGADFRLNGAPLSGLDSIGDSVMLSIPAGSVLSGTLADGMPFSLAAAYDTGQWPDRLPDTPIRLERVEATPITGPTLITASSDEIPRAIGSGQTLLVDEGASVGRNFKAGRGSTVTIQEGGSVGAGLEATNAEINLSGGLIGGDLEAFDGSIVNLNEGALDGELFLFGSTLNLKNVILNRRSLVRSGSVVNIDGGSATGSRIYISESIINLRSGVIGDGLMLQDNSHLNVFGGSVRQGLQSENSSVNVSGGVVLQGFTATASSVSLSGGEIQSAFKATQSVVEVTGGVIGDDAAFTDTALTVAAGQIGHRFSVSDGSVQITGGTFGDEFEVHGAQATLIAGAVFGDDADFLDTPLAVDGGEFGKDFRFYSTSGLAMELTDGALGDSAGIHGPFTMAGGSVGDGLSLSNGVATVYEGQIGDDLLTYSNSTLVFKDGEIGADAYIRGELYFEGGRIGDNLAGDPSSSYFHVSGGTHGSNFRPEGGLSLYGDYFFLNGNPVDGLANGEDSAQLLLANGSVLTGVLSDGTPFAISDLDDDRLPVSAVTLSRTNVPESGPAMVTASSATLPKGIRHGQTLRVDAGGVVPADYSVALGGLAIVESGGVVGANLEVSGAELRIEGGEVGDNLDSFYGTVSLSDGAIGSDFYAIGSVVSISGGAVGANFLAADSTVTIDRGEIGSGFGVLHGGVALVRGGHLEHLYTHEGEVQLSGGTVDRTFAGSGGLIRQSGGHAGDVASPGGKVQIAGGTFASLSPPTGSGAISLEGGLFFLNGEPISGLSAPGDSQVVQLGRTSTLSGVLSDGTPVVISGDLSGWSDSNITLLATDLPAVGPAYVDASVDTVPAGIRQGQTLHVSDGSTIPDNLRLGRGSALEVSVGGFVGKRVHADSAQVALNGGAIDHGLSLFNGSMLEMTDGRLGGTDSAPLPTLVYDSEVDIHGGSLRTIRVYGDSRVSVTGGEVEAMVVHGLSSAAISGGSVGNVYLTARPNSSPLSELLDPGGTATISGDAQIQWLTVDLGSEATVTGGVVESLSVRNGGAVTLSAGEVAGDTYVYNGGTLRVEGGSVRGSGTARGGSDTIITSGRVGPRFSVGGNLILAGGVIADTSISAYSMKVVGGDLRLDDNPVEGLLAEGDSVSVTLPYRAVLTGVLADGTPFVLDHADTARLPGTITLELAELPPLVPGEIVASVDQVPYGIREGQTLRVDSGAVLEDSFTAGRASSLLVEAGGHAGSYLESIDAEVVVAGGAIGEGFDAYNGSRVTLNSGEIGSDFRAIGSSVVINDGTVSDGLNLSTGTLAQQVGGSVGNDFYITDASYHLAGGALGRSGEVREGGVLTVAGGAVGSYLTARAGSTVVVVDGLLGSSFDALSGSTVSIEGGIVDRFFDAKSGSYVSVSGGKLGSGFRAESGSVVDVFGGAFESLTANSGSSLQLSGGSFPDGVSVSGELVLSGGDFRIDGIPVVGLNSPGETAPLSLATGETLTGVFSDGTPFAFSTLDGDRLPTSGGVLHVTELPPVDGSTIVVADASTKIGARGQAVIVEQGGSLLDNFAAGHGSSIRVLPGGAVGRNAEVYSSTVSVLGGAIGDALDIGDGSTLDIHNGSVGAYADVLSGGEVSILGGSLGQDAEIFENATLNVFGGNLEFGLTVRDGGALNIFGTSFTLAGESLDEVLVPNTPYPIDERYVSLNGVLLDGGSLDLFLRSSSFSGGFASGASISVTLLLPGDFNRDGMVDLSDYELWKTSYGSSGGEPGEGADGNYDGRVDAADYSVWRDHLIASVSPSSSTTIPEPRSAAILVACWFVAAALALCRGRSVCLRCLIS